MSRANCLGLKGQSQSLHGLWNSFIVFLGSVINPNDPGGGTGSSILEHSPVQVEDCSLIQRWKRGCLALAQSRSLRVRKVWEFYKLPPDAPIVTPCQAQVPAFMGNQRQIAPMPRSRRGDPALSKVLDLGEHRSLVETFWNTDEKAN